GPDLAIARQGDLAVRIFTAFDGNTFTMETTATTMQGQLALTVGRFDADAQDDIAATAGSRVAVWLRAGSSFGTAVLYPTGVNPRSVLAVDLNRHGAGYLLTANATDSTVSVLLGNGDGCFQARQDFPAGNGAYALAVADLDRDGKLDIVTANTQAASASVLLGNGDGTL